MLFHLVFPVEAQCLYQAPQGLCPRGNCVGFLLHPDGSAGAKPDAGRGLSGPFRSRAPGAKAGVRATISPSTRSNVRSPRIHPRGRKSNGTERPMPIKNVQDFLIEELRDTLSAEKQLVKALPKMAKAATDPQLQEAFLTHLEETKTQVERLEKAFAELDTAARAKTCEAMKGLVEEGQELMEKDLPPEFLDVGLIIAAQKVEHYEIAAYGSLVTLAKSLDLRPVAMLLAETLDEEKNADKLLTKLAAGGINRKAISIGAKAGARTREVA
jgi:ferritin-like metal-binding protein YciE